MHSVYDWSLAYLVATHNMHLFNLCKAFVNILLFVQIMIWS
jgi:hypothetical protein